MNSASGEPVKRGSAHFEIHINAHGMGSIVMDGQDLSHLTNRVVINAGVGTITQVTVTFWAHQVDAFLDGAALEIVEQAPLPSEGGTQ